MSPNASNQKSNGMFSWGTIDAAGNALNKGSENWTSNPKKEEKAGKKYFFYEITWKEPVKGEPVVVVSGYRVKSDPSVPDESQDNAYSVHMTRNGFEVHSFDVEMGGSRKGERQAAAFSFIAISHG